MSHVIMTLQFTHGVFPAHVFGAVSLNDPWLSGDACVLFLPSLWRQGLIRSLAASVTEIAEIQNIEWF